MSRSGMADNIARVRSLTYAGTAEYTVGTATYWDDDQVQDVLDRHRYDVVREELIRETTYLGGGSVEYTKLRSRNRCFEGAESGATVFFIEDGPGTNRSTATYTPDYQTGEFVFDSDVAGTVLYLTGRTYDVHGAAAELLEAWAAREAACYDFTTDGQTFNRSQKAASMRDAAKQLRKQARVRKAWLSTS